MIFSPTSKRFALVSEDEKRKINEFIYKIDPRALQYIAKKQNTKVMLAKASHIESNDGKIDPEDAKKYLRRKKKGKLA
jgi:hypothetical protein